MHYSLIVFILFLIMPLLVQGCQKVDKPVRGEAGSGEMAIVIDGDPPDSHTRGITSTGKKLDTPYSKIPLLGALFKKSFNGFAYWKAYHPDLTKGTHNPILVADTEEEHEACLDCHDEKVSCNNCHGYVGVRLITSDE